MAVSSKHPDYLANLDNWHLVKAVINSDIKDKLRSLDAEEDRERNVRYSEDAVLLNFTARTRDGFLGRIFNKDPQYKLPPQLEYLLEDATPEGFKLKDFAQDCLGDVLAIGRSGFLVDFPPRDEHTTVKDVALNNIHARFCKYDAENIINWYQERINGRLVTTLIVLEEKIQVLQEDLSWANKKQYRHLRLIDGIYVQLIYDEDETLISESVPLRGDGAYWNFIPFVFLGSKNNNVNVDKAPMLDLAVLNLGHYKNSADLEEMAHIIGQPVLVITSGMSQEQFTSMLGGKELRVGARRGIFLGESGTATYAQPAESQIHDKLMERKEEQGVKVGAQLIQSQGGTETAEAARMRHGAETSVLQRMAQNMSSGIETGIKYAAIYENVPLSETGEEIEYQLNQEFFDDSIDPVAVTAGIQLFDRGIISAEDLFDTAKKAGIVDEEKTMEETQVEINKESPLVGMYRPQNQETQQPAQFQGYSDSRAAMGEQ